MRGHEFGYRPALDGLRGVAVVAVLLFHSGFSWARGGYLGVSAFFTLSGFLITTLLLVEHDGSGRISLKGFWARRFRRLLPAALLGVALASVYVMLAAPHDVVVAFRGDGLAALFDVANWHFVLADRGYLDAFALATGVDASPSPVLHFWSLAIEEQFYFVFPPLLYGIVRLARGRLAVVAIILGGLGAASATTAVVLAASDHNRAYFGSDTRAVELLVGALLAVAFVARRRTATSERSRLPRTNPARAAAASLAGAGALALCIAAWASIDHRDPVLFRGVLVGHAALTAVVIAAALGTNWFARALAFAPLAALGRISYGVYVYHWPIFQWIDGGTQWSRLALRSIATLAVALLSYHLIEQPIRHGRAPRLSRRAIVPAWIAVVALVVGAWSSPPAPTTVFAPVAAVADRPVTGVDRSVRAVDADVPLMPRVPSPAAATSSTAAPRAPQRVMIVGDSVALTLGRGLERWGSAHGVAVWNLGRPTCGIPRAEVHVGFEAVKSETCEAWPRLWAAAVEGFRPDVVVVLSPIWDAMPHRAEEWDHMREIGDPVYDEWLLGEYADAADVLGARGARVVWLDVPCGEERELQEAGTRLNRVIERLAAQRPDVGLVSLRRLLCHPSPRFADTRDVDGFHFSDQGADVMATWLMPKLAAP